MLTSYIQATRRLLHDLNGNFWTDSELTDYINEGRTRTVQDTGCLRSLQSVTLTLQTEAYTYGTVTGFTIVNGGTGYSSNFALDFTGGDGSGVAATAVVSGGAVTSISITNNGSGYSIAPSVGTSAGSGAGASITCTVLSSYTLDVLGISAIWGNTRYPLLYKPFSDFSAFMRPWVAWYQRPYAWTNYGQSGVYVGPLPDQNYASEFDTVINPYPLVDDTTAEQIASNFQGPIKYYAAYLAKNKEQSFGESDRFSTLYRERILECINSTYTRRIPNMWEDL